MPDQDKILELEEELRKTKYNKRTQHHIGLVKAKIAKLRRDIEVEAKKGGKHEGFSIKRTGDATVVFVGFPSVGKSTLLNALTNAQSEVGAYDFTTLNAVPGMLIYKGEKIQLLDIPGLILGAAKGSGRGREILSVIKSVDLVLIVLDEKTFVKNEGLRQELYEADIRLNEIPPDVSVKRKGFGGIDFGTTLKLTKTTEDTVKGIMRELGFTNASIVIRQDITQVELLDVLEANRCYIPMITVLNKLDTLSSSAQQKIRKKVHPDMFISSVDMTHLESLKDLIFKRLELVRIFMKQPGKEPDMEEPLIMKRGVTVEGVCKKLHRDLIKYFRYAKVWGSSKFPGQQLGQTYELKDGDVLQLVLD